MSSASPRRSSPAGPRDGCSSRSPSPRWGRTGFDASTRSAPKGGGRRSRSAVAHRAGRRYQRGLLGPLSSRAVARWSRDWRTRRLLAERDETHTYLALRRQQADEGGALARGDSKPMREVGGTHRSPLPKALEDGAVRFDPPVFVHAARYEQHRCQMGPALESTCCIATRTAACPVFAHPPAR